MWFASWGRLLSCLVGVRGGEGTKHRSSFSSAPQKAGISLVRVLSKRFKVRMLREIVLLSAIFAASAASKPCTQLCLLASDPTQNASDFLHPHCPPQPRDSSLRPPPLCALLSGEGGPVQCSCPKLRNAGPTSLGSVCPQAGHREPSSVNAC